MVQYSEMIRFMDKHGFSYQLPKREELDEKNPFHKVLCFGIVNYDDPQSKLGNINPVCMYYKIHLNSLYVETFSIGYT